MKGITGMLQRISVPFSVFLLMAVLFFSNCGDHPMDSIVSSSGSSAGGDDFSNDTCLHIFASATYLDSNSILNIAQYYIATYLYDDIQTRGKVIVASHDFIDLYTVDDELFAYLVPLLENEKEIGFITVGAIDDGYDAYQISINDDEMKKIREKVEQKRTLANSGADSRIVFMPPRYYVIRVKDDKSEKYYDISDDVDNDVDVTSEVIARKSEVRASYTGIRSAENKDLISKYTPAITPRGVGKQAEMVTAATSVSVEDVRLVNESAGSFVPVKDGATTYYGGNQSWYSTSTKQGRGCGPTAAANITCYLARKNKTKYGKLYAPSSMAKSDFVKHMNSLYSTIDPGIIGATSLTGWTSKVESFARSRSVTLTRVTSSASFTLDNTATYIKNGLRSDCPVATLNLQPPYTDYDYAWHWMTITKYFRDSADRRWIAVSSWGKRYSINYRTHFSAMKDWLGGGLMYFK